MKKALNGKWVIILLLCVPAMYIVIQLFAVMGKSYVTQTAVKYTLFDTITCMGALGMSESDVTYDGAGMVGYLVENSERVSEGNPVAIVFPSINEAQNSAFAAVIQQEIEVLEKAQNFAAGADVETLLRQSYAATYDLLDVLDKQDYTTLHKVKNEIQRCVNKMQMVVGKEENFAARIDALRAQHDTVAANAGGTVLNAPYSGYFVSGEDSAARLYTTQQLQDMTVAEFTQAVQNPSPQNPGTVAGKIIEDYKWRFFASVTMEESLKFQPGAKVHISFGDLSTDKIPATVVAITEDTESGYAKIELLCDYINENVVTQEHASAVISFQQYEGLRIDKRAERFVGDTRGVYVRYGSVAYFRPISVVFENETYMLVSEQYEKDINEVQMFDEVILEGKNLENGKIIEK